MSGRERFFFKKTVLIPNPHTHFKLPSSKQFRASVRHFNFLVSSHGTIPITPFHLVLIKPVDSKILRRGECCELLFNKLPCRMAAGEVNREGSLPEQTCGFN